MSASADHSIEEVRAVARYLKEGTPNWYRESFGDFKSSVHTCDNAPKNAVAMLTAYADLREQIERAREGVTDEVVERACVAMGRECAYYPSWATMRAALQSVAHLLPSGERGGVGIGDDLIEFEDARALAYQAAEAALRGVAKRDSVTNEWLLELINRQMPSRAFEPAHQPAQVAGVDKAQALAHFTDYFVRNYPGPNTIISDPNWHAPKIFRAAMYAIESAMPAAPTAEPVAQGEAQSSMTLEKIRDFHLRKVAYYTDEQYPRGVQRHKAMADAIDAHLATQPASPEQPAGRQGEVVAVAPFIVGNAYRTQDGELVRFVSVHNEGTSYETMEDEVGVHRYTRRDFGRVTGTAHDYSDPRNTPPLYTRPAAPVGVPDGMPRGWKAALAYAIDTLDCEIDIRENDSDPGNRNMKRNQTVLRQLLEALAAAPSAPQAND